MNTNLHAVTFCQKGEIIAFVFAGMEDEPLIITDIIGPLRL